MKNPNDSVGNLTRDLTACSAAPQTISLPRTDSDDDDDDNNNNNNNNHRIVSSLGIEFKLQFAVFPTLFLCLVSCHSVVFAVIITIFFLELHNPHVLSVDASFAHHPNANWCRRRCIRDAGGWIETVSLPDCVTELLILRILFAGDFKDGQNASVKEISTGSTSDSKGELSLLVEHGESLTTRFVTNCQ
jgi:hypothetical protein